ncbi:hypothetical protein Fmac_021611 [Flemingia macrophylla]|uniref:Reticulon domain-containing protein n=1 Tax=Flemingia macrophylla TaxID=520843 RepID=A0ABD1LXD1_9FABA
MDCFSSPYHHRSRTKSSSRLPRTPEPLRISLDVPPEAAMAPSPSPLSLLRSPTAALPLRDLLLLSPSSARRSRARFDEEAPEVRRRCKSRAAAQAASPRSSRRWRREEKEAAPVDEAVKQRKRRHSGRHHRKERLSLVPFQPPSTSSPKADEENGGDLDRVGVLITDLIMWRDVSKSSLWFGLGCLCFLSSCFTKGFSVSMFSAMSRLAIVLLGVSFFSNSVCQRNQAEKRSYAMLKEDDILHLAKLILPALNFAISKTRELFSGEPCRTLKVAPFLLLGAEYGHLITIWRLCAIGEDIMNSIIHMECLQSQEDSCRNGAYYLLESVYHKDSNLHSVYLMGEFCSSYMLTWWKVILKAFILLVVLRYFRQKVMLNVEDGAAQAVEKEQQQALIVAAEPEKEEPRQALVVVEQQRQC